MRSVAMVLLLAGCVGGPAPTVEAPPLNQITEPAVEIAPVDERWEYKVALQLKPAFASYLAIAESYRERPKVKKCRSIQFYDTPDRSLRAKGELVRVRVKRDDRGACFREDGSAFAAQGVDLTYKGVFDTLADRGVGAPSHTQLETDWIAGKTSERLRYSWKVKQKLDSEGDTMAALLVALGPSVAKTVGPICDKAVEQLVIELADFEVTVWRHEGVIIAAEASFDGAAGEQSKAKALRERLDAAFTVAPQPMSKTQAVFERCPPPAP